jgi:hypothetical protein
MPAAVIRAPRSWITLRGKKYHPWMNSGRYFTPAAVPACVMATLDRLAGDSPPTTLRHIPQCFNHAAVSHLSPSGDRR